MKLQHVLPVTARHNCTHSRWAQPVITRNQCVQFARGSALTDASHITGGNKCMSMALTARQSFWVPAGWVVISSQYGLRVSTRSVVISCGLSVLMELVGIVVRNSCKHKMTITKQKLTVDRVGADVVIPDASRGITRVKDNHLRRNRCAASQAPRGAMGTLGLKVSIPVTIHGRSPKPTLARAVDLRPESRPAILSMHLNLTCCGAKSGEAATSPRHLFDRIVLGVGGHP